MRLSRVPSEAQGAYFRCDFWAIYTTNMFDFEFPTGTGIAAIEDTGRHDWYEPLRRRLRRNVYRDAVPP